MITMTIVFFATSTIACISTFEYVTDHANSRTSVWNPFVVHRYSRSLVIMLSSGQIERLSLLDLMSQWRGPRWKAFMWPQVEGVCNKGITARNWFNAMFTSVSTACGEEKKSIVSSFSTSNKVWSLKQLLTIKHVTHDAVFSYLWKDWYCRSSKSLAPTPQTRWIMLGNKRDLVLC